MNADTDLEKFDLLSVFEQKDIGEMDDDELLQRLTKLHDMRKIRMVKTKKKSMLDRVLDGINVEKARIYLEALEKNK